MEKMLSFHNLSTFWFHVEKNDSISPHMENKLHGSKSHYRSQRDSIVPMMPINLYIYNQPYALIYQTFKGIFNTTRRRFTSSFRQLRQAFAKAFFPRRFFEKVLFCEVALLEVAESFIVRRYDVTGGRRAGNGRRNWHH